MTQLGRERGWPAMTPEHFQALRAPGGSLAVGDPQEVADKLMDVRRELGADRVLLHLSVGTMPHERVLRAVELLGSEVAPASPRAARGRRGIRRVARGRLDYVALRP